MTASSVIEYYRQFAFVNSVLAGFAFSFYGVLLSASAQHRATNLAALLAVMASIAFLLVTLGMLGRLAAIAAAKGHRTRASGKRGEGSDRVWSGRAGPYLSGSSRRSVLHHTGKDAPHFSRDNRGCLGWSLRYRPRAKAGRRSAGSALATIEALHKAGIPIVAGTDAPNEATAHGVSLHEELQILVQAKFTPQEALEAVTALPVKIFRLGDRGHIAAGYRADLLLVDGDPTQNIGETLWISRIWKNRYEINRAVPTETPKRDPKQD
jgi:hypothetical protein